MPKDGNQKNRIIHCLIPARKGSKGIKDKNIKLLNGKPLMAYSIEIANKTEYINKIILTTDSEEYARIGREYGADTPFIRPSNISDDLSLDIEFMNHYLNFCKENNLEIPDAILHLRPTFPCRKLEQLNNFIKNFLDNWENYDSSRSVILSSKSPYKMYQIFDDYLVPLYEEVNGMKEPYNQPRQVLPKIYLHNGCYDIIKTQCLLENSMSGNRILPYVMEENDNIDIDDMKDLERAKVRIEL